MPNQVKGEMQDNNSPLADSVIFALLNYAKHTFLQTKNHKKPKDIFSTGKGKEKMKKKFLILLMVVLAISCALTSCFKGQKEAESLKINEGLKYEYALNETPDFSGVKVTVTYNDDSTEEVGADKLTFSSLDTTTPGKKQLTITYEEATLTVEVTVKGANVDEGGNEGGNEGNEGNEGNTPTIEIWGAALPANLASLENKKVNYLDKTQGYVVGDDNPYVLTLKLEVYENDQLVTNYTSYTSASKVYLVNGDGTKTLLEGDAIATYVVIDETKNSFDFTDAAVGKTFEIVTRPAANVVVDEEDVTCAQTVTVVDGYNIYTAKELNLLTNNPYAEFGNDDEFVQVEMVNEFLAANNITRPEKMAGMVLHNDMIITVNDLPAGYFVPASAGFDQTYVYDFMMIYNHAVSADNPEFSFYGNYYTIDSRGIPEVPPKNDAYNDDGISNTALFMFTIDETIVRTRDANGNPLVAGVDADAYKLYNPNDYVTNIYNLALRDDEPNSGEDSDAFLEASKRALLGIKTRFHTVNITNTRVEAYMLSLLTDYDHQIVNLHKVDFYNAWQNHIFASSKNLLWERNDAEEVAPTDVYYNPTINITESKITKCGGPVIISQTDGLEDVSNSKSANIINIDDATEIYSYVTGNEPWFKAYGVTDIALLIKGMSGHISNVADMMGAKAGFLNDDQAMNIIMVNMVSGNSLSLNPNASPADLTDIDGKLTIGDTTVMNMNDGENPVVDAYVNGIYGLKSVIAPVLQTSAGGTCASDGQSAIFGVDFVAAAQNPANAVVAPSAECFAGDYITVYYLGIGITFEYYNPSNTTVE